MYIYRHDEKKTNCAYMCVLYLSISLCGYYMLACEFTFKYDTEDVYVALRCRCSEKVNVGACDNVVNVG